MKCIGPKAKDADWWIALWERLEKLRSQEVLIEVEHDTAHRNELEKQQMSLFEKFITESNEIADESVKAGAMLDGWMIYGASTSKHDPA